MIDVAVAGIATGEISLVGRVMPASNATFVGTIGEVQVVYKPVRGERPLWDFPDGTLAQREVAAYAVSEALGWQVVPPTVLRDGPHGPGMVQAWAEPDPQQAPVDVVARGHLPDGFRHVFDALDGDEQPVALVHEDSAPLRRMAVFDVLVNNGDRKGGHVLAMADGHRYGVDHGVSFHVEEKLRTVLWGWVGEPLSDAERDAVRRVHDDADLLRRLSDLVTEPEVAAYVARCEALLAAGEMPAPSGEWPAIPWPAF
ncbi:SCO1664 family protein [Nocardioides sp. AE5]|uniref:SCO1664 family protein n=1 Tax=Nocardioides sp. AE5 TaxID=2962573 RepID=UPI0028822B7F|nr:SCO1664 family protein [Nocardioides sp. AE5]MDT0203572.1 SCO1664 family protein [Nocardioides sp. AE5]